MQYNQNLSEVLAVVAVVPPSSQAVGEQLAPAVLMDRHRRLLALINVGSVGAAGTVNAQFKASATSGGTYTAVPGTAINQISTSNNLVKLEIKAESLQSLGVGPYVKLSIVAGTNAVLTSAELLGSCDRYEAASDNDATAVAQVLVV